MTIASTELVYNLFMEYCPSGTLRDAIDRCGGSLGEPEIARYIQQILNGLEHLHSKGIVHCDVKPRNILISEEGAKISDFGCAKRVDDPAGSIGGTPLFMAPEVARGEEQGRSADVWALGCTVIEMATGKSPWSESGDPFSVMYRVAYSAELPEIPSHLSDEAEDFLSRCLRRDPSERWTVTQLLKHPFLAQLNSPVSKQSEELNSCSPTCVLDHGFWSSSWDEPDHDSLDSEHASTGNSAADRTILLSLSSGLPDWSLEEEEDWVTVRGTPGELETQTDGTLCESVGGSMDHTNSKVPGLTAITREILELSDRNSSCCKEFLKCRWREGGDVIRCGPQRISPVTSIPMLLKLG